jgi:hypothetical protein
MILRLLSEGVKREKEGKICAFHEATDGALHQLALAVTAAHTAFCPFAIRNDAS